MEEVEEMEEKEEGSKERKRARKRGIRDTCISLLPSSAPSFSPTSFFFSLPELSATSSRFLACTREREPNQVRLYVHFMTYGQWRGRVCEARKAERKREREIATHKGETQRGVHRGRWTASAMEGDGRRGTMRGGGYLPERTSSRAPG